MLRSGQALPSYALQCNRKGYCFELASTSRDGFFRRLRERFELYALHLGSNAVRVGRRFYGAVFHGLRNTPRGRTYLHFPYFIDAEPPHAVAAVAAVHSTGHMHQRLTLSQKPFVLPRPDTDAHLFMFCTHLAWVDGRLVIGYGRDDRQPLFYITTPDELFGNMRSVDSGA